VAARKAHKSLVVILLTVFSLSALAFDSDSAVAGVSVYYRSVRNPNAADVNSDGMTTFSADVINRSYFAINTLEFRCQLLQGEGDKSTVVFDQPASYTVENSWVVDPLTCERKMVDGAVLPFMGHTRVHVKVKVPKGVRYDGYWLQLTHANGVPYSEPKADNIFLAASRPDAKTLQEFISRDAKSVNRRDANGNTPLHLACLNGQAEAILILLKAGADVNARNDADIQPIHYAAAAMGTGMDSPILIKPLIDAGADANAVSKSTGTPLEIAALHDDAAAAEYLLERGADPNGTGTWGPAIVQALRGAGGTKCLLTLLEAGADPNAVNKSGTPAILIAAARPELALLPIMLAAGADVNAQDPETGFTALHVAVECGYSLHVKVLLHCKANVMVKDKSGKTASDIARAQGLDELAALLDAAARQQSGAAAAALKLRA